MATPSLCVVVVSWNNKAEVLRCLESLKATAGNFRAIVVDNASQDDTVTVIKAQFPEVTVHVNETNRGYSGGNNDGIKLALETDADYVLLLNDDAVVAQDAISEMLEVAVGHPEAGLIGPAIYSFEDSSTLLSAGGDFVKGWRVVHRTSLPNADGTECRACEVGFLSGCALLCSKTMLEVVGSLDERFFAYQEDVDWSYRARQAGFKLMVAPRSMVWHPDTRQRDEISARVMYYMSRNRLLFLAKHRLGKLQVISTVFRDVRWLVNWSVNPKWRHLRPKRDALWFAVRDFALGRTGKSRNL